MPFTADTLAAQQVQEHLKAITQLVHEIEKKRQVSEQGINNIIKYQSGQDEKAAPHHQMKIKNLCKAAITQTENEEELLRKALQRIADIRTIKNERRIQARLTGNKESIRQGTWMKMLVNDAQCLPLFVGKIGESPPPLCGAIPADAGYIAKVGDMVAAHVKIPNGDKENWIIAEVISYNHSTNKYEVDDFLAEPNQEGRHFVGKRGIVPLPLMRANPETDASALFPQGAAVMALYPTTTCFYRGIVNQPPTTHTEDYKILFEDASYPAGYSVPLGAAQRYVIANKQKSKQT